MTIPAMGVEEANIIINTLNPDTTYNLLNPDGYGYIQAEMDAMSIKAKTFTVIKIEKPKFGEWILKVRGISGDQVKVDMVYNASISIDLTSSTGSFEWNAGRHGRSDGSVLQYGKYRYRCQYLSAISYQPEGDRCIRHDCYGRDDGSEGCLCRGNDSLAADKWRESTPLQPPAKLMI